MSQFEHEDKLVWQLEQLPGIRQVELMPQESGLFQVNVTVEPGQIDAVWGDLVEQVDAFERSLDGGVGLDLEIVAH